MRRLILQMQTSLDGFVEADPTSVPWQLWDWGPSIPWDKQLISDFNETFAAVDTILLSRPMVDGGYLAHWASLAATHPSDPDFAFTRRIGEVDKVVVTRGELQHSWPRTRVTAGAVGDTVRALKERPGQDIIAFGGVRFASALASAGVVDEFQFYVNPTAAGRGANILTAGLKVDVAVAQAYSCGMAVLRYSAAAV
jgi:dihydrofolate reductase